MCGNNIQAVILAAGKSKRFNTGKSKQVVHICGQAMILYPLRALSDLDIASSIIVGKYKDEIIKEVQAASLRNVDFIEQAEANGTGGAVLASRESWNKDHILILNGDLPLITSDLIEDFCNSHLKKNADISFLTSYVMNPKGYGRVIDSNGKINIVEDKECSDKQREINRINAGVYLIKKEFLDQNIDKLQKSDVTGEYYITDIIKLASEQDIVVNPVDVPYDSVRGVNTLKELWAVEQIQRSHFIDYWMEQGVRFQLAQNIHIDINVKIGRGSFIGTGVHLIGNTVIGENCTVGAFTIIEDTNIGDYSHIHSHSVIQHSNLGSSVDVGPYARFRNNVVLRDNVQIGNFVEVKNSTIDQKSKAKHLSYIGDANIGACVNIGAGTITCNHDGCKKNKTTIEDNAYIGSNNTLVAPVTISKDSYVAAGSTITKDVSSGDLAIGRSRQINKIGYAEKIRKSKQSSDKNKEQSESHFMCAFKVQDSSEKSI